jgi:phospholipid/cholesterol/gamma-HCH transport system substrate-binding protein
VRRADIMRFVALGVTVVLGFGYILFDVIGIRIGDQRYPVAVQLADAGGIYPAADVTFRGVNVGVVESVTLQRTGVLVHLGIDPGVRIPADSSANVREMTAAGEQYLDLVPTAPGGPDLHAGSVIGEERTSVPTSIDATLVDFGTLLTSLDPHDIETLNAELARGFGGEGAPLHTLLAQTDNLIAAFRASQGSTVQLQVGGAKVLRSLITTNSDFSHFTASLRSLSGQFVASNADLGHVLTNGTAAVGHLHTVLAEDSGSLEGLIDGLGTISDTAYARNPAIQALFQALPVFATNLAEVTSGGTIQTHLLFNTGSAVCPYVSGSSLAPPTQRTGTPDLDRSCPVSAPGLLERGAAHAPAPDGG